MQQCLQLAVNVHLGRTISNRELLVNEFLERFLVGVLEIFIVPTLKYINVSNINSDC